MYAVCLLWRKGSAEEQEEAKRVWSILVIKMRSDNTVALQGMPTGRVFRIGFLYQTKGKRPVDLWPQELAEDSSGAKLASGGVVFSIASGAAV